jgi:uncharacterized membrane protein
MRPSLRAISTGVALAGLAIATYLTATRMMGGAPVCAIAHGCEIVQRSTYATLAGIPVATLGMVGYLAILVALARDDETARTMTAFLALAGAGFSGWLTWVEVQILGAICIWCVASAVCMTALAGMSVTRMLQASALPRAATRGGSR